MGKAANLCLATRNAVTDLFLVQLTFGFETLDKEAALGLATATPLTDLRQYINSDLGFSNLEIWLLCSK